MCFPRVSFPSSGYTCYDLSSRKTNHSRHVWFDENSFPFSKINNPTPTSYEFLDDDNSPLRIQLLHDQANAAPPNGSVPQMQPLRPTSPPATHQLHSPISSPSLLSHSNAIPTKTSSLPASPISPTLPPVPRMTTRSQHGIFKPNLKYKNHALSATITSISPIPRNPVGALNDPNWKNAMQDEYNALIDSKTWELVPRPSNANIIRSLWIFRHKKNSDGSFERHKARLVGDGGVSREGVDCDETFIRLSSLTTIRVVLTIALSHSWPIHQLDVKNAFLHGNLNETVYMYQPLGFRDPTLPDHVCLLRKSLYGLKQAPRAWYQRFAEYVATIGFSHSTSDNSLFLYCHGQDTAYILLYVDDIILTASSDYLRLGIMSKLATEFAMKDLGPLSYFLGIAVSRDKNSLFMSQSSYAEDILGRAGMSQCNPCSTPVDTKGKLSATSSAEYEDPTKYRRLAASALQYLTFTRRTYRTQDKQVCLFMHDPKVKHMEALKRILRYIRGTIDFGTHLYKTSLQITTIIYEMQIGRMSGHSTLHIGLLCIFWG
ncbi:hypothetical protein Syun_015115 [Stephania yunnanensis]|uniref:Reverse transcriptase Ty1/copia-type domain-containing protein n=1 Tax=Stephania yunnanensis TaxID=152371 RepID=A0AAP0JLG2_9MAGN